MQAATLKRVARQSVLGATFALLILLVVINLASTAFNPVILLAQLVPLGLTLPGLLKGSSRTMQWICFADMFYLVQGILLAFSPGSLWIGLLETAICLVLFVSAIIFIRAARVSP